MSTDDINIQKLLKIENEIKKSTQTPSTENQSCFEDEEDEEDQVFKNENNRGTGLMARSSCADEILMKTLIAKYANRLMDRLDKIAVKVPTNSNSEDAVVRLRRKLQRLLKDIDQAGGPRDSSTVLLKKYDCLRMAYYSIADGIKRTKTLPFAQGVSVTSGQLNNLKNCDKIKKCKDTENLNKLDHHEKRNKCENHDELEKLQNCKNEKLENIMKLRDQEKLDNCKTSENLEKRENCANNEKPENHEKRLFNCEYCGRGTKLCHMTCDSKLHSDKENCQNNFFEWKSFFKRRFFIYFPCVCCICDKSV
ncbi:hypothetical protein QTP88_011434 [Uroleucon formosanum]